MEQLTRKVTIYRAVNDAQRHIVELGARFERAIEDAHFFATQWDAVVYNRDVVRFERVELEMWFDTSARFASVDKEVGKYGAWRRRENSEVVTVVATKQCVIRKGVSSWKEA